MPLFEKPEYKEVALPFIYADDPDDNFACILTMEAYGDVFGKYKYCVVEYQTTVENIDELSELLKDTSGKTVKVILKLKKGKVKGVKFDLDSLAQTYNDDRFKTLELLGWGYNDKSFKDKEITL